MTDGFPADAATKPNVTVHYWASAKSAAGVSEDKVAASTLAELLDEITTRHRDRDRFGDVIGTCSILIGETPVGARVHAEVLLKDGDTIEFLPPFAGG